MRVGFHHLCGQNRRCLREAHAVRAGTQVAPYGVMLSRTRLAALAILSISSTASAGVYAGLGVGTAPVVNGSFDEMADPSGPSTRGMLGFRIWNVSVEGAVNGFGVNTPSAGDHTAYQASAALKLNVPVAGPLEGFGRGGIERTWLSMGNDREDLSGNGFLAGVGFELRLNAILASMSLFADYTLHHATLESMVDKVDATSHIFAVGVTVGM